MLKASFMIEPVLENCFCTCFNFFADDRFTPWRSRRRMIFASDRLVECLKAEASDEACHWHNDDTRLRSFHRWCNRPAWIRPSIAILPFDGVTVTGAGKMGQVTSRQIPSTLESTTTFGGSGTPRRTISELLMTVRVIHVPYAFLLSFLIVLLFLQCKNCMNTHYLLVPEESISSGLGNLS